MALLPDVVPCQPIPTPIEGCLATFLTQQAQDSESLAALTAVFAGMKTSVDNQLSGFCAQIDGLTPALTLARQRETAINELCGLINGVKQAILEFRQQLLATTGADCPELVALEVFIDLFKTLLLTEIGNLNIPGTEAILGQLNALKLSFECQSSNLDQLLSFLGGAA